MIYLQLGPPSAQELRLRQQLFPPKAQPQNDHQIPPAHQKQLDPRAPEEDLDGSQEDEDLDADGSYSDGDDTVPLVDYDEKHIHAGQHLQPPDEPHSPPAVANLLDLKDWEGVSVEDMKLFTRSVRQQILSEKLKSYKWSPALLESVLYFPDLQEPSPMIHEDRQKLTQETPDLP